MIKLYIIMSSKHINFIFNINHASNGPTSIEINNNQIGFQIGFQKKIERGPPPFLFFFPQPISSGMGIPIRPGKM